MFHPYGINLLTKYKIKNYSEGHLGNTFCRLGNGNDIASWVKLYDRFPLLQRRALCFDTKHSRERTYFYYKSTSQCFIILKRLFMESERAGCCYFFHQRSPPRYLPSQLLFMHLTHRAQHKAASEWVSRRARQRFNNQRSHNSAGRLISLFKFYANPQQS